MGKYEGKDNYGKQKSEYVTKVTNMNYDELMKETEDKIWLSAFAANNPRSDYHWHVDVCYDELYRRVHNDSGYMQAWEKATSR